MTDETYINILEKRIDYTDERISIHDLKFYEKNPRVLSKLIRAGKLDEKDKDEKQELIMQEMRKESSVKKLRGTIKAQGGISDPLIVQMSTREVLEGNSRLTALRELYKKENEEKYLTAPCRMVHLEEDEIDAFLHQQHVDGKTEWSAYDKAYSAYHRVEKDKVPIDDYAARTSDSKQEIEKRIKTIKLMHEQEATELTDRFSHYDQMIRSNNLKQSLENISGLKEFLLGKIKEEPLTIDAQDLRDKVPQIAKKPKVIKKWMDGKIEFDEAVNLSKISQPKQHIANAIKSLKEIDKRSIQKLDNNDKNAFKQEVKKCRREIDRIEKIIAEDKT